MSVRWIIEVAVLDLRNAHWFRVLFTAGIAACLAGCASPPKDAYVGSTGTAGSKPVLLGANSVGESCTEDAGAGARAASIYCGSWQQPSARVVAGDAASPAGLPSLATASTWRVTLDRRVACADPQPATVLGEPAVSMRCTRRIGGWPQLALVTIVDGHAWYADGVAPALPAMERGIGVLSGRITAEAAPSTAVSAGLQAQRLASESVSAADMSQYERLLTAANYANLAGNYAGAEAAYRAVASLQTRLIGRDAPALARTWASEALQLSNQGRYAEAEAMLARAETRAGAPGQADPAALPLVWHYRGLHELNRGQPAVALQWLRRADTAYRALLPPNALSSGRVNLTRASASGLQDAMDSREILEDESDRSAIYGVIEVCRAEAVAQRRLGHVAESRIVSQEAVRIMQARGIAGNARLSARVYRTDAMVALDDRRPGDAIASLQHASKAFARGLPSSTAYAETGLLLAGRQAAAGQVADASANCSASIKVLQEAGAGVDGALIQPCLQLMADEAARADTAAIHAKMFEVAQLAQGTVTSIEIAKASARLAESARDPKVAALIRAHDDVNGLLADLYAARDELAAAHKPDDPVLDKQVAAEEATQAETDAALQAASPNYGQLIQHVVPASSVLAALHPGEAFVSTMLSPDAGWSFLLRDGEVTAAPITGGQSRVAALVARIRVSLDAETQPPPAFDVAAAHELYNVVLGPVSAKLQGATSLVVAPTGPLLSVPFGLLLTGAGESTALADAPWLIRQMVVAHVPAPANFVSLRKLAGSSRATQPWFGFGDFQPVTPMQAAASFPANVCGDSASLLTSLPPLPGALQELGAVRRLTGGGARDELLGRGFTANAVLGTRLKPYRILHFATHALLPTDLKCQSEPALVTSAPPGARDAGGALLTASEVSNMDLDADAVVLSACNTGGPAGAGESLSGLARSFFYAGARSLLVTHWAVNDRITAYLVALSLATAQSDPALGLAGALAQAQRRMLSDAKGDLAGQAHPFYWAPLALVGEGGGTATHVRS